MRVEPHHTAGELAGIIRSASRGKVARRLTAVRLALLGYSAAQVLLSERQVRTWVARYNADPAGGLSDRAGRGRKPPLDAGQEARLAARLRAGPRPADGVCALRGEDVRRILREEFGVAPVPAGRLRPAAPPRFRAPAAPAPAPVRVGGGAGRLQKSLPDLPHGLWTG